MEIVIKTDVKEIMTVGTIFKKGDCIEGIITAVGESTFEYLDLTSKVHPGNVKSVAYEEIVENGVSTIQLVGNILDANIAYKYPLGSFIPKFYKTNGGNIAGSIVLTTAGRLAFVVRSDCRRNYCELIYLEPPVKDNLSNVQTMKFFYSDIDFLYRIASYRDYSLVF